MEEQIMKRLEDIISEYAQLPQFDKFDLEIESYADGSVLVTIKKGMVTFKRLIGFKESLEWISDTFYYPDTFTPQSKDINATDLLGAYFGDWGDLIVVKKDSTEVFRVKDSQREEIATILKGKLGKLFNKPKKVVKPVKNVPKIPQEIMFQIYYTKEERETYFIVAGDSIQQAKATALDVISKRGLDLKANKIFSKRINN
jgi:hypothetical protein